MVAQHLPAAWGDGERKRPRKPPSRAPLPNLMVKGHRLLPQPAQNLSHVRRVRKEALSRDSLGSASDLTSPKNASATG